MKAVCNRSVSGVGRAHDDLYWCIGSCSVCDLYRQFPEFFPDSHGEFVNVRWKKYWANLGPVPGTLGAIFWSFS